MRRPCSRCETRRVQCEDPPTRNSSPLAILNRTSRIYSPCSTPTAQNRSAIFVEKFFECIGTESVLVSALSSDVIRQTMRESEAIRHAISAVGASFASVAYRKSRPDIRRQYIDYANRAYVSASVCLCSHMEGSETRVDNETLICALLLSFFEVGYTCGRCC